MINIWMFSMKSRSSTIKFKMNYSSLQQNEFQKIKKRMEEANEEELEMYENNISQVLYI